VKHTRISRDRSDEGWTELQKIPEDRWHLIRVSVDRKVIPFAEIRTADEFTGIVEIRAEVTPVGVVWRPIKGIVRIVLPAALPAIKRAPAGAMCAGAQCGVLLADPMRSPDSEATA
jgi:hypothetical protein